MAEQTSTKRRRWLFPFTTGVDLPAIDSSLRLAEAGGATLVAVSFFVIPDGRRATNVRLELLQQSQDFLEAVRYKACRLALPVECHAVVANDILEGVTMHVHQMECESIVLASKGTHALFLQRHEMQQLLLNPPASLLLLRFFPDREPAQSGLLGWFLFWLQAHHLISAPQDTSARACQRQLPARREHDPCPEHECTS